MMYYKFYIQKESGDTAVKELGADFGFYEMESKFYGGGEVKDVPQRSWYDEDGDDEFVPSRQRYKAFEAEIKFGYKGGRDTANAKLTALKNFLNGGTMKLYDSFNKIGRQNARFEGIDDDAELVRSDEDGDILIITIKFKVNDPVTEITLTK